MPWYLRKALTHGPIRFNLSKRGLGASIGVTGLRVGIGPKGTYVHGGRSGLYYRKYLTGSQAQHPDRSPALPTVQIEPGEGIERVAVPAADDEVAAEISARLNAFRPSVAVFWLALLIGVALVANHELILAGIATASLLITSYFLSRREAAERRIEFSYDLEGNDVNLYQSCVESFREAAKCAAIWRIVTQTASRDTKYTAGAGTTVERSMTQIAFNDRIIHANLQTVWLSVAGGKLCLLPDRMFYFGRSGVVSLDYSALSIDANNIDFRESGPVPADSTNVGTTWQYVNKAGGPDRRFSNNRQLPIQRYSDLNFTHPRLSFSLEFSQLNTAGIIAQSLRSLVAAFHTRDPSVATPIRPERTDKPAALSNTGKANAAVANVKAALADLKSTGKRAPVVFHLSPSGPNDKIKAWLTSFADEVERLLQTSAPLFDEARQTVPIEGALILEPTDAFQRCRSALAELSGAVTAVTHIPDARAFGEKLSSLLQTTARIEREFNEARMPASFDAMKVQFAAMIEEMLADIHKWPSTLGEQAAALGTATSCQFDLAFTLDTATLIVGVAQATRSLIIQNPTSSSIVDH